MNTSDFKFIFLGQSVLRYQVPLDVYHFINDIYEKINELYPANKQLVGKIKKSTRYFLMVYSNKVMKPHRQLPDSVMRWFCQTFKHYLNWNNIKEYKMHLNSCWVNEMKEHEYNTIHVHQGSMFTGLSSVMILKLFTIIWREYSHDKQHEW